MTNKHNSEKKQTKTKSKSILGLLIKKQDEKDDDYIPELQTQWQQMNAGKRIKFVLGSVFGLLLFVGALVLTYYVLSMLIR